MERCGVVLVVGIICIIQLRQTLGAFLARKKGSGRRHFLDFVHVQGRRRWTHVFFVSIGQNARFGTVFVYFRWLDGWIPCWDAIAFVVASSGPFFAHRRMVSFAIHGRENQRTISMKLWGGHGKRGKWSIFLQMNEWMNEWIDEWADYGDDCLCLQERQTNAVCNQSYQSVNQQYNMQSETASVGLSFFRASRDPTKHRLRLCSFDASSGLPREKTSLKSVIKPLWGNVIICVSCGVKNCIKNNKYTPAFGCVLKYTKIQHFPFTRDENYSSETGRASFHLY